MAVIYTGDGAKLSYEVEDIDARLGPEDNGTDGQVLKTHGDGTRYWGDAGLDADINYYVSSSGSDTTGDGSQAHPFATPHKALSLVPKNLNGHIATIIFLSDITITTQLAIENYKGGSIRLVRSGGPRTMHYNLSRGFTILNSEHTWIDINLDNTYSGAGEVLLIQGRSDVELTDITISATRANRGIWSGYGNAQLHQAGASGVLSFAGTITGGLLCATVGGRMVVANVDVSGIVYAGRIFDAQQGGLINVFNIPSYTGTLYYTASAGRIYAGAQANAPNY